MATLISIAITKLSFENLLFVKSPKLPTKLLLEVNYNLPVRKGLSLPKSCPSPVICGSLVLLPCTGRASLCASLQWPLAIPLESVQPVPCWEGGQGGVAAWYSAEGTARKMKSSFHGLFRHTEFPGLGLFWLLQVMLVTTYHCSRCQLFTPVLHVHTLTLANNKRYRPIYNLYEPYLNLSVDCWLVSIHRCPHCKVKLKLVPFLEDSRVVKTRLWQICACFRFSLWRIISQLKFLSLINFLFVLNCRT